MSTFSSDKKFNLEHLKKLGLIKKASEIKVKAVEKSYPISKVFSKPYFFSQSHKLFCFIATFCLRLVDTSQIGHLFRLPDFGKHYCWNIA